MPLHREALISQEHNLRLERKTLKLLAKITGVGIIGSGIGAFAFPEAFSGALMCIIPLLIGIEFGIYLGLGIVEGQLESPNKGL